MKTTIRSLVLISALCLLTIPGFAQGAWIKLGIQSVNYRAEKDEFVVSGQKGSFTALKIRVLGAPVNMRSMVVNYRNGTSQEILLRNNFAAGSESRICDLSGSERIIRSVVFWYDTKNFAREKAKVELWARR